MTATTPGIINEIRRSLKQGATLRDIDSTDDRLVLVLGGAQESKYQLDAEATRSLLETDILDRLTSSTREAKKMLA